MIFQLARLLYSGAVYLSTPLLIRSLNRRAKAGNEDPARIPERYGIASARRPAGNVLWVHGASVGESMTILPVIEMLIRHRKDLSILMTTGTVTSARLLDTRLPDNVCHQFVPLDRQRWVDRFLDHWKPDAVVWMESEFWPNTINALSHRRIPLLLVNGRISDQSFIRWQAIRPFTRGMLRCFTRCLAQSEQDARRLRGLGAPEALNLGNLKLAAAPLAFDSGELDRLTHHLAGRHRWLMASTHADEDPVAARAHRAIKEHFPDILSTIVPRHARRGPQMSRFFNERGYRVALRSRDELPDDQTDFYIADTMGELGTFYRLSEIVFVGKSMNPPGGGQNPLEAVKLGRATLFGPYMTNFAELSRAMLEGAAARQVKSADELQQSVVELLANPELREKAMNDAARFGAGTNTILDDVAAIISDYLPTEH